MNRSLPVIPSSCGSCTACCTVMAVEPIAKGFYSSCKHLCELGCAIYNNKPSQCSVWECAWRSGWIDGDERRRPDQLGVMFEFHIIGGSTFLWAYEVWPDAFDEHKVRYLLQRLEKKELVVRIRYGVKKLEAPSPIIDFIRTNWNGPGTAVLPRCTLQLASGDLVEIVAERVGNKFILSQVESQ